VRIHRIWALTLAFVLLATALFAQDASTPATAQITGTVTDVSGDTVAGATVSLEGSNLKAPIKLVSDDNGFFAFQQLASGTYRVTITAQEFATWTSSEFALNPGQYMIVTDCKLHVAQVNSTVNVVYRSDEVATEQVRVEETQRVFGIIPNFYVVYDPNPVPLTTKLKFRLAMKTSTDVFTVVGVGAFAAINQAGDTPNYVQGWKGYGERVGAASADGFSDIMIGGALLPSLLRQDPRYYFKGTGTTKSRIFHAISSPFICRGDNGKSQPNYSSVGGDIGSAALSNLYYPQSNRGTGLIFQNFGITTGERMLSDLVQEFVLGRLTARRFKN
jgi:carboxypeptidase family protein